jgi:anthranilate/para-aminobenzoate synthase component II
LEVIAKLGAETPIFGVCLGHQSIGQHFGASVVRAERMARRTRGSEIMVLPGATHYAALEYPEMINLRLEKFFRERGYEAAQAGAG